MGGSIGALGKQMVGMSKNELGRDHEIGAVLKYEPK